MIKVLLPVDGSPESYSSLELASQILDKQHTRFFLLHVISKVFPELFTEEYQVEDAVKLLKQSKTFLEDRGCDVERAEYVLGDPVDSICRYADEMDVDQILMGSHGASGILKTLLGSVSAGVMEHASKPVFIFRPQRPVHALH